MEWHREGMLFHSAWSGKATLIWWLSRELKETENCMLSSSNGNGKGQVWEGGRKWNQETVWWGLEGEGERAREDHYSLIINHAPLQPWVRVLSCEEAAFKRATLVPVLSLDCGGWGSVEAMESGQLSWETPQSLRERLVGLEQVDSSGMARHGQFWI